ncbi:hypothetical protein [Brevibacillus migulae]|uniref:hypothetical protein n=1 Tax=Brevibacillus migulae TaxID=1644114 RepID=UPI00106E1682|nr:hypothetical protein [Brevibacillus migulae]
MNRTNDYNERFKRFSRRIERGIILLLSLSAALLLAGELVKDIAPVRNVLVETERLEGISPQP